MTSETVTESNQTQQDVFRACDDTNQLHQSTSTNTVNSQSELTSHWSTRESVWLIVEIYQEPSWEPALNTAASPNETSSFSFLFPPLVSIYGGTENHNNNNNNNKRGKKQHLVRTQINSNTTERYLLPWPFSSKLVTSSLDTFDVLYVSNKLRPNYLQSEMFNVRNDKSYRSCLCSIPRSHTHTFFF